MTEEKRAAMDELYHHGVLGMKWGVRRYQDYGEGGYVPKEKRHLNAVGRLAYRQVKKERFAGNVRATLASGALTGIASVAGVLNPYSIPLSMISTAAVNAGIHAVRNYKDKKAMLLSKATSDADMVDYNKVAKQARKESAKAAQMEKVSAAKKETPSVSQKQTISKEEKQAALDRAKKNDSYSMDFLEAVQNKKFASYDADTYDRKQMLKAYSEYLDDPEDFWKRKRHEYEDE